MIALIPFLIACVFWFGGLLLAIIKAPKEKKGSNENLTGKRNKLE